MPVPRRPAAHVVRDVSWWRGDHQRGLAIAASLAVVLGGLLAGYGVQVQMASEAARKALHAQQVAMATKEDLRTGSILYSPDDGGHVCRRRWIDNATWLILRGGSQVDCDEATGATAPPSSQQQAGSRMEALRGGFGR